MVAVAGESPKVNPMKLTPLIAAAMILVAAAPSASALCVANKTCVAVNVRGVSDATGEVVGTAIAVAGIVLAAADDLSEDADDDSFPDMAEQVICGNDLLYGLTNLDAVPGHCATRTDYIPPDAIGEIMAVVEFVVGIVGPIVDELVRDVWDAIGDGEDLAGDVVAIALGIVNTVYGLVDADGDLIPDDAEFVLCLAENENLAQDGSCSADNQNYTPPHL